MDAAALEALAEEPLAWRAKGLPLDTRYPTINALRAARPSLFDGGFPTPVGTLARDALEHNLATMAGYCEAAGVLLAPHGKTTMAPQLFERQLAHGAWGITAATPWQVRVFRAFGVSRVLLANELVDADAIAWLAGEMAADPGFSFLCYVDDLRGVERLGAALGDAGASRPVDVLVEVGFPGGRTGCRDDDAADAVAAAAAAAPDLRLVGVAGYEGTIGHEAAPAVLERVRSFLGRIRATSERLDARGLFHDGGPGSGGHPPVVLTAGGSAFYDQVAEVLSGPLPGGRPVDVVLRSGGYVTHDEGLYADVSPFTRRGDLAESLRPAVLVWTRVLSRPEPTLALVDGGRRDLPFDSGMPIPRRLRPVAGTGDGPAVGDGGEPVAGMRIERLDDQHGYLRVPEAARVAPGDWLALGISHPCTAFDKWSLLPVVEADGTVVDAIRTYF